MNNSTDKVGGPSAAHALGAAAAVFLGWGLGHLAGWPDGGAAAAAGWTSGWFLAREIEQAVPHYGLTTWRIPRDKWGRIARQAGWPILACHSAAAALILT